MLIDYIKVLPDFSKDNTLPGTTQQIPLPMRMAETKLLEILCCVGLQGIFCAKQTLICATVIEDAIEFSTFFCILDSECLLTDVTNVFLKVF